MVASLIHTLFNLHSVFVPSVRIEIYSTSYEHVFLHNTIFASAIDGINNNIKINNILFFIQAHLIITMFLKIKEI